MASTYGTPRRSSDHHANPTFTNIRTPKSKHFPLLNLLPELQLLITANLTAPEVQLLRATCRSFYNLLPPPNLKDLYDIMASPYNRYYYSVCDKCHKLYDYWNWKAFIPFGFNSYECLKCGCLGSLARESFGRGQIFYDKDERAELRRLRREQGLRDVAKWDREEFEEYIDERVAF